MKLVAVMALLLVSMVGQRVEHAPTVEQCRADQALWYDQLEQPSPDWGHSLPDISARSLYAMADQMTKCVAVDAEQIHKYNHTTQLISLVIGFRRADFMIRHNLEAKFFEEDNAGAR